MHNWLRGWTPWIVVVHSGRTIDSLIYVGFTGGHALWHGVYTQLSLNVKTSVFSATLHLVCHIDQRHVKLNSFGNV